MIFSQLQLKFADEKEIEANYQTHSYIDNLPKKIDSFLIDFRLKNTSGLKLIEKIRKFYPDSQIFLMTGFGTIASAIEAIKLGADDYLIKPVTVKKIKTLLLTSSSEEVLLSSESLSLDRVEREYIEHILAQEKGNITKAARKLGIHRQSLQRKLKKWVPK